MEECCISFWKRTSISKDGEFKPVPSIICSICKSVYTEEEYFKLVDK